MKVLSKLLLETGNGFEELCFGIPTNEDEKEKMYSLRYQVYSKRGYINADKYKNDLEMDELDRNPQTKHFIALFEDEVIGSIRLIQNKEGVLPTEKVFNFKTPEILKELRADEKAELGRLIARPPQRRDFYFPRNLVMLSLIKVLVDHGKKSDIKAGYAFIKKSLERKMGFLRMPIKKIDNYNLDVDKSDVLYNYFTQAKDPVLPMYFITSDFDEYINNILDKHLAKKGEKIYLLKDSLYSKFLKKMKIL